MNTHDKNDQKSPDGSTDLSSAEADRTDELADGSQSDGSAPTEDDTASGGPAD
jgi:hypothetical protein